MHSESMNPFAPSKGSNASNSNITYCRYSCYMQSHMHNTAHASKAPQWDVQHTLPDVTSHIRFTMYITACSSCNTHIKRNQMEEQPQIQETGQPTTKVILLIRHGDYHHWTPTLQRLTTMGQEQARCTGTAILVLMKQLPKIEAIYTSPLLRAKETANIVAPAIGISVPLIHDKDLEEGDPAVSASVPQRFHLVYQKYKTLAPADVGTTTILVTHANLIRYFICR